jgi:phage gp36-like protein
MIVFCTREDIENRLSVLGTAMFSNDELETEVVDNTLNWCIEMGTADASLYLQRYDLETLASNDWVRLKTTVLAVWWLCGRRGQTRPEGVQKEYDEVMLTLKDVATGKMNVPGATMPRNAAPTLINRRVNPQLRPPVRVDPITTTAPAEGYRRSTDPGPGGLFPS